MNKGIKVKNHLSRVPGWEEVGDVMRNSHALTQHPSTPFPPMVLLSPQTSSQQPRSGV